MTNTPGSELKKDVIYAAIGSSLVFLGLNYVKISTNVLNNIDTFHSTITTLLGLLFTILAIIYTFESQFKENRAVKILIENDQFVDVIQIFFHTVVVLGVVWLYTFILTVFDVYIYLPKNAVKILSFLVIFGFFAVIIRLWRCLEIFILLDEAIRENS